MNCLWRKSPSAPCSCAYQLRSPVHEVLNHLCQFGQGTLVLRQQGLSLAKMTPFGLAISHQDSDWTILHDALSGLETDTRRPLAIYLMSDTSDRRPLLAMGEPNMPVELSIRLDGYAWESPAVTALLRKFNGVSLDCMRSRRLGAGAWLDEWGGAPLSNGDGELAHAASRVLRDCASLEVEIKTHAHRNVTRFRPSFVDTEGRVLRIADRACRHVVYADAEAADFRLITTPDGQARMFREVADSAA